MQITLPVNNLHNSSQIVTFEKVTALIGENGAGKSSILQSLFHDRLFEGGSLHHKKVVCFSSGQNEKYSKYFSDYLTKERQANRGLNLGCCYYDKSWSSLLIFIATMMKEKGRVRFFLANKNYIEQSENEKEDISSTLRVSIRVEKTYVNRVQDALKEEESGDENTFRTSDYHRTLESFIHTIVNDDYEFEVPLTNQFISLKYDNFFNPSFSNSDEKYFEPVVTFFTQAADNDYFFDKQSMQLTFKNNLTLSDLSDGEYQILFLYSLLDLFDSEETIFLLDEVDSHLHYKNIENLWVALHSIQGYTLTTTHLLDSITAQSNNFNNLKVVDKGVIKEDEKIKALFERLSALSRMKSIQFDVCCKVENIVLIDDYNDWKIFLALANKKELDISLLSCVNVVKQTSSYGSVNEIFGKAKLDWVRLLLLSESEKRTKNIFLICDRDEAPLQFKTDCVSVSGKNDIISEVNKNHKNLGVHLLSWNRREIKNYLLSYTALSHYGFLEYINNNDMAKTHHLKKDDSSDNEAIKNLNVKKLITKCIDSEGVGLDVDKLNLYVSLIPSSEISADIESMYNFIVEKCHGK
ncbi:AAA family ATPase [Pectobacterium sp. CHL-2024]|uniref:AAA family ATPase n=1 Tax=Pectobacterium sp. CHL-2024 TaxID=3377079 RepID=UPI00380B6229